MCSCSERVFCLLQTFLARAATEVSNQKEKLEKLDKEIKRVIKEFGEEDDKMPLSDFLSQISSFAVNWRKAHEDNVKQKQMAEKKAERERKMKERQAAKAKKITQEEVFV